MSKPYWSDGQVALYLGDCREILPALSASEVHAERPTRLAAGKTFCACGRPWPCARARIPVDCIIADPPYGETSLAWDRWPEGWLDVAAQVTRSLWCFGSLRLLMARRDEFTAAGWKLSQDVVMRKQQPTSFTRDRFRRAHELATHWYRGPWSAIRHEVPLVPRTGPDQSRRAKGGKTSGVHGAAGNRAYEDTGMRLKTSVLDAAPARRMPGAGGRAAHRTGKPEGILADLITYACPPGGLIVDPFAGSCPSLRVARETGRRAIGIEADETQAEQSARWLSQMILEAS